MSKESVLIVDDSVENLKKLKGILKDDYSIKVAKNGLSALEVLKKSEDISLIISDINMPELDGYELCKRVKKDSKYLEIPFIFLTASQDSDDESKGFKLGGADYITKPFSPDKVLARTKVHISLYKKNLELKKTIRELDDYKRNLEFRVEEGLKEIKDLNSEILKTQKEVIFTMGAIGESRSKETGQHVKRVAEYSYLLAKMFGLSEDECQLIKMASPMHDIGKVAIPDSILNKPGRHTPEESAIMKTHAKLGYEMLSYSKKEIFKAASTIAYEHHEKWDGSGYPRGLKGEEIHIYGRVTAIADVFDALGHDRCYKKAWKLDKIFDLFKEERGKHFDPNLIDLFFSNLDHFLRVKDKFK